MTLEDVEIVRVASKETIALGLRNSIRLLGYTFALYTTSPKLAMTLGVVVPAVVGIGTLYARVRFRQHLIPGV